jgi:hypothetical protein
VDTIDAVECKIHGHGDLWTNVQSRRGRGREVDPIPLVAFVKMRTAL